VVPPVTKIFLKGAYRRFGDCSIGTLLIEFADGLKVDRCEIAILLRSAKGIRVDNRAIDQLAISPIWRRRELQYTFIGEMAAKFCPSLGSDMMCFVDDQSVDFRRNLRPQGDSRPLCDGLYRGNNDVAPIENC